MQETTLQFGSPFKLCAPGRDSGSFLWKNIGYWQKERGGRGMDGREEREKRAVRMRESDRQTKEWIHDRDERWRERGIAEADLSVA